MFLLPAIGAWISDGLILYIYFTDQKTNKGSGPGGAVNNTVACGNALVPCRRIQALALDEPNLPRHDGNTEYTRSILSSFPKLDERGDIEDSPFFSNSSISSFAPGRSQRKQDDDAAVSVAAPEINEPGNSDKVGISASDIESHTEYLEILAIIRLILLSFPLSYAAYSGTRVPCVIAQYLFHGISSMVVVSHMLAVLILDGDDTLNPNGGEGPFNGGGGLDGRAPLLGSVNDDSSSVGGAWTLLSLSLVSILLHFLIVLHVRSTGPVQDELYEEKRKRKRLAYAMADRSNGAEQRGVGDQSSGHSRNKPYVNGDQGNDEEHAQETRSPLLLPEGESNLDGNKSFKERFMCLPDQYEAFVSDTQARFDAAQRMWGERLEVMTKSLQHQNSLNSNSSHSDARVAQSSRNLESSNLLTHAINTAATNATKLVPIPIKPDPFKVVLQLFAYEDVWSGTHSRLDLAFAAGPGTDGSNKSNQPEGELVPSEGSAALSFYAPQLLSFLLHGAYFDVSTKLEQWILKKCGEDFHFAHRCFWFLRSWCLGSSSDERNPSQAHSLSSSSLGGGIGGVDISPLEPESGSYSGPLPSPLFGGVGPASSPGVDPPATWDSYSGADAFRESTSSKFSPDEERLIEQLIHRVVEEGSRPATIAQYGQEYGSLADDSNAFSYSPSALATAVEQGLVPIDPRNSSHSTKHLDCITAAHKYGFLPLPYQKPSHTDDAAALFFAAPVFLDALLSIADDLMNTSRAFRTAELRRRLRSLEVELLPSNVVYLPIQNMNHRVWRCVSDESIALSTNERVPCIITLEVIDYGASVHGKQHGNTPTDSDSAITAEWVKTPRPPHRHSTLIDKVAGITQEGLRRLEDTFEHISAHGSGEGVLERRLADFLGAREGSWSKSAPLYAAVKSNDEEDEYNGHAEEALGARELGELQPSSETSDDELLQFCPPPPLGGPALSDNTVDAPETPRSPTPPSSSPDNDNQESPMGQWSTPKTKRLVLRQRNTGPRIENIISEEEESDEAISPQGKQRTRVLFPPTRAHMARDESVGDKPIAASPLETDANPDDDTDVVIPIAPTVVFREDWKTKTERLQKRSIYGSHPGWRLLPILIKSNDDLRQEQLASQLIQRMALILAKARVPVWLYPYEIVALTGRGGIIECVPDTISIDSLKRNDPDFTTLKSFFEQHFGGPGSAELANANANFVESLAAYSIVCFLLQLKDRHNGNILLTNQGHIVHIDFGFFFLSSPGKNSGFESAPFKLTRDFVKLMDGPNSRAFQKFRELCYKTFIELRKHCYQIILLVEMLTEGNEDLACFCGKPEIAVKELKERFRLDLNDNGIRKYVDSLIDESLENWRTRWYDRYQRFCVGVL
ncbi:hypothetical protein ACHAWF_012261 [Thalassiosira exigua]